MRLESDRVSYYVYKYHLLICASAVFVVFTEDATPAEKLVALAFGLISATIFLTIRKKFVRVRMDDESIEVLSSRQNRMVGWQQVETIEFYPEVFDGIIFRFRQKSDNRYFYSITDMPKNVPLLPSYRKSILKTEIGQLIQTKKAQLKI